jgi:hypothetical protein
MIRLCWLLLVLSACQINATAAVSEGCPQGEVDRVSLALDRVGRGTLNEVPGMMGYFKLTNSSSTVIPLSGWFREGTFWLEFPVVTLQVKNGHWEDIIPMLGSFTTTGDDKKVVRPGESLGIAARIDFGVPPEARTARLLLHLPNKTCIVSKQFPLPLSPPTRSERH